MKKVHLTQDEIRAYIEPFIKKHKCVLTCFAIATLLCIAQLIASRLLILICLAAFMAFVAAAAYNGKVVSVLLFFLPWAPFLKVSQQSISAYTIALVLSGAICCVRKKFAIKKYGIVFALLLCMLTMISKLTFHEGISNSYIQFICMFMIFPYIIDELRHDTSFEQLTLFFALGIIYAAFSAKMMHPSERLEQFIVVKQWKRFFRYSGFYGDPNYYSAHICAALSGVILMIFKNKDEKQRLKLIIIMMLLMYCGLLSGSKSFFIIAMCVIIIGLFKIRITREKILLEKTTLIWIGIILFAILAVGMSDRMWGFILERFKKVDSIASLTTGRLQIWAAYMDEFINNGLIVLIGKGCTKNLVIGRASHNTVIQIIYQLGIAGMALYAAWAYYFVSDITGGRKIKMKVQDAAILLIGLFLPWMGLDMLFFDEFFIIPMYAVSGAMYINTLEQTQHQAWEVVLAEDRAKEKEEDKE